MYYLSTILFMIFQLDTISINTNIELPKIYHEDKIEIKHDLLGIGIDILNKNQKWWNHYKIIIRF